MALDDETLDRFAANNIMFYDPQETDCGDDIKNANTSEGGGSASTSDGSSGLAAYQEDFVKENYSFAQQLSVQYGIPWETVVAQGIWESASGTSDLAVDKNNFFGIGAYDSCPYTCAFSYATKTEGWEGYYKNIVNTSVYRANGVFQGDAITDPYVYLTAIKNAGYATDPNYVNGVSQVISGIEKLAEQEGWMSSKELSEKYPEMITNAEKNAQGESAEVATSTVEGGDSKSCKGDDNTENGVTYATYEGVTYAFPLMYASKEATSGNGFLSTLPCDHEIGCHYGAGAPAGNAAAAFDICFNNSVEKRQCVGAKVVSMADGYITRVTYKRNNADCNHVRIKSSSDSYVIAYMHMAYDASIIDGMEVKAGDLIGEVSGTDACHDNSTPHVHVDMGSDPNATGGPMEDERNPRLTKIMNEVYNALPETEEELQERMSSGSSTVLEGLSDEQIEAIAAYYRSDSVSASEWVSFSGHGKWNCVALSAWFVQQFTSIGKQPDRVWGYGRSVAHNLINDYSEIKATATPKPFTVFGTTSLASASCMNEGYICGHTGLILRVDGDQVTTLEAYYNSEHKYDGQTFVNYYTTSDFWNDMYPNEVFADLSDIVDVNAVKSIAGN